MVHIGLQISATLENVDRLLACHPNYCFFVKVSCSNCLETGENWHGITECERTFQNTRNPDGHNFYMKCKMCRHENTIDIIDKTNETYSANDSPNFKTIVLFDCRGVEPVDFSPRSGWIVHSTNNGQTFENIDLSEDDWVEYDTKNKCSVGIFDFKSKFLKLKK